MASGKLILVAAMLLGGCQSDAPTQCRIGHATDLALTYHAGHMSTPAILNGSATTMMLDTGAQDTVLTRATADRLAVSLTALPGQVNGIGGSRGAYAFYAQSFQIGALHGKNLPLMVTDMNLSRDRTPVDGLFGSDFLAQYQLDLDFIERKARLFKVVGGCRTPAALLDEPLYQAPLRPSDNPYDLRPFVRVQIGGKTLTALVDSGAQGTLIFRNSAHRIGLNLEDFTADPHFKSSGVGPRTPDSVRHVMAPITIGEITIARLPVTIVDQRSFDDADMLLGMDFLARVHVWLSFSSHTMIMQYPPRASPTLKE